MQPGREEEKEKKKKPKPATLRSVTGRVAGEGEVNGGDSDAPICIARLRPLTLAADYAGGERKAALKEAELFPYKWIFFFFFYHLARRRRTRRRRRRKQQRSNSVIKFRRPSVSLRNKLPTKLLSVCLSSTSHSQLIEKTTGRPANVSSQAPGTHS